MSPVGHNNVRPNTLWERMRSWMQLHQSQSIACGDIGSVIVEAICKQKSNSIALYVSVKKGINTNIAEQFVQFQIMLCTVTCRVTDSIRNNTYNHTLIKYTSDVYGKVAFSNNKMMYAKRLGNTVLLAGNCTDMPEEV